MRSANATRPERGPKDRQYRKLYGAFRSSPLHLVILGKQLVEKWMHYDTVLGRNMPCVENVPCEYCQRLQRRTYKAFLAAVRLDTKETCVAEITEHALKSFERQQPLPSNWRGYTFTLKRMKHHKNAPVHVFDIGKYPKPQTLPAEFDVEENLHRLWGWVLENPIEQVQADRVGNEMRAEPEPVLPKRKGVVYY